MFRTFSVFSLALLLTASAFAQGASWLRGRASNALNPRISVIPDFVYQSGPGRSADRFSLREVELTLQAEVDPNTRADFFVGFHDGDVEIEEAYITILALPLRLQARGGRFLPTVGRLNTVHRHELDQVDFPLAFEAYFGEEGLRSEGAELSRIFTPFGAFIEISYAFMNGLGEDGHAHDDEETTIEIVDPGTGAAVEVPVHVDEGETSHGRLRDFANIAKIRAFRDIGETFDVDLGLSGVVHEPAEGERRRLGVADLTFRWKPARTALYRSVMWRSAAYYSNRDLEAEANPVTGAVVEPAADHVGAWAGYSYLQIQSGRRWRLGVRGDYLEDPVARTDAVVTRAVSPYVTFYANEFNRWRVQYTYKDAPDSTDDQHIGYLQWTVVVGPHGAHEY